MSQKKIEKKIGTQVLIKYIKLKQSSTSTK